MKSDTQSEELKIANCDKESEKQEMSTTTPLDVIQVPKQSKSKQKLAAKAKRAELHTFPWKNSDDFNIVQLVLPMEVTLTGNNSEHGESSTSGESELR